MARSSWKIPFITLQLLKDKNSKKVCRHITIQDRATVITPTFIGQTVYIGNGLHYLPVMVTERHIGFKFGAFALTKKRARLKK